MKNRIVLLFVVLNCLVMKGQINEIGIIAGGSNYVGDIGRGNYIYPIHGAFGVIYKWNKSTRHSYRASLIHSKIDGNDEKSDLNYRLQRGFKFVNTITEANIGIEFNFFDFDLHQYDYQFTPYISTGFSAFLYDSMFYEGKKGKVYENDTKGYAIPMIVGIKTRLSQRFILGLEVGARYTFTDNLDGSNPDHENLRFINTGNKNSNDWYVFSLVTLTYTFGKNPCFCPQ